MTSADNADAVVAIVHADASFSRYNRHDVASAVRAVCAELTAAGQNSESGPSPQLATCH